jgi:hypothetical protein
MTGDYEQIHAEILSGFTAQDLERLVRFRLNVSLFNIVPQGSLSEVAFKLIEWAKLKGRLDDLIQAIREERRGSVVGSPVKRIVELILYRAFDSYTQEDQDRLLAAIRILIPVGDVRIISKERGSVKLKLELAEGDAQRLVELAKAGELAVHGVVEARLLPPTRNGTRGWRNFPLVRQVVALVIALSLMTTKHSGATTGRVSRVVRLAVILAVLGGAAYGVYVLLNPIPQGPTNPREPDGPRGELPSPAAWQELARTNPVALLANALNQYKRTVEGFTATLEKEERVDGKLHEPEVIALAVQGDVPAAPDAKPDVKVRMVWEKGARKVLDSSVRAALYIEGRNDNRIWTWRPDAPFAREHSVGPKESIIRGASRYCIRSIGLYQVMLRTHAAWDRLQKASEFRFEYEGLRPVEKLGGRPCHVIRRICLHPEVDPFALDEEPPTDPKVIERDGFTEVKIFVDAERWIQVGTEHRKGSELIGAYYYRDLVLNPTFPTDTFTTAALMRAVK